MNDYLRMLKEIGVNIQPKKTGKGDVQKKDVVITTNSTHGRNGICIRFTAEKTKVMPDRISPLIVKNRIYFDSDERGYKLSIPSSKKGEFKVSNESGSTILRSFIGDYELKYDELAERYFIEKEEQA